MSRFHERLVPLSSVSETAARAHVLYLPRAVHRDARTRMRVMDLPRRNASPVRFHRAIDMPLRDPPCATVASFSLVEGPWFRITQQKKNRRKKGR